MDNKLSEILQIERVIQYFLVMQYTEEYWIFIFYPKKIKLVLN